MLQAIRERIMGVMGWVILGFIFIAFAFFGLNSYLKGGKALYAASVNGVEISTGQENNAYQNLRKRMVEMLGSNFDPDMIDEAQLRKNALTQLINEELLLQEAVAGSFSASDQQLAAQINSMNAFKENGRFSRKLYERLLYNNGMSPAQFEAQLKRDIVSSQFRAGIEKTAAPTPRELDLAYRLQGQKRRFSYLILPAGDFRDQVKITDAQIEEYFKTHGQDYMTPERVKVQYLELDAAKLDTGSEPDEAALRELYAEDVGRFTTGEERHARHILVTFKGTDEESIRQAEDKAAEIEKRLDAGEAFDALARELSEDPGSASNGGDLGYFGRGIMTPEFETAVFGMKVGERSKPVRSPFGLHIIELMDIKPETVKPFEEVRDSLVDQLLSRERSDLFYEKSEELLNMAFEYPDTLQEAATALGLEPQESDWISRDGGPGIGEIPAVVEAAFSEDVLLDGNNSGAVELGEDHILVLRVSEHRKPAPQSLEDVRDVIRKQLEDEQARALAKSKGESLLTSLQSGTSLQEIASEQKLETGQSEGLVGRNASTPERSIVLKAFSLPVPAKDQAVPGGFVMKDGNYALVVLNEVQDGRLDALDASERMQARQELGQVQGASEMSAVMEALTDKAEIHIPEKEDQQ